MEMIERYRGALLGLAVGDALGMPLERLPPGTFKPVHDMIGRPANGLLPGEWTDDTALTLCLADSLIACHGFDPLDQMRRYLRWYREGYMSCTGFAYGIGRTSRAALRRFEKTGDPYSGSTDPKTAGNGSLMRLPPVPLCYARNARQAVEMAAESSRTTHQAPAAMDACRYFGGLLVGALRGESKDDLLAPGYTPVPGL